MPRASPVAPTSAPSHARYVISCTPIPSRSSSKCRDTLSTNQLQVFSFQVGRSVLLNKDYCLKTSSSSKIFNQGGNAWNLLDFDNQSAAIICVDTIKYYSIPSVPSRLEGVKTRTGNNNNSCNARHTIYLVYIFTISTRACHGPTLVGRPGVGLGRAGPSIFDVGAPNYRGPARPVNFQRMGSGPARPIRFQRMGRGLAQPITFSKTPGPARPGPSHGSKAHETWALYRPARQFRGPARGFRRAGAWAGPCVVPY